VHHSQERLTFVTGARFHPVEQLILSALSYIPLRIAGFNEFVWLPLTLIIMFQAEIEHSQIPWKYGPFYRILVSPRFHSFHHSIDPACRDKHFGQTLCVWDYMFGTAVKDDEPIPSRFGVENVKPVSLWDTLATPFLLLREYYAAPQPTRVKS
jgi:sterol desaturase/sphingolipid hydroxylase (fatty acid hydroxylase superfamily)